MLAFDPSRIEAKREGRVILANVAGIPLEEAAPFFSAATHQNFRSSFNAFTKRFPEAAKKISDHRPEGIGPGEMIAWFIFDNITLGGKNSAIDLLIDGEPFTEMKGGQYNKSKNALEGFKITKDGDLSVDLILSMFETFNSLYKGFTSHDLPGWNHPGDVRASVLDMWSSINLDVMQRTLGARMPCQLVVKPDGTVMHGQTQVAHTSDHDLGKRIEAVLNRPKPELFPSGTSDIQVCWINQAMVDYIRGKRFALMNAKTFEILFHDYVDPKQVSLHRMHRNQPWASIKVAM